MNYTMEQLIKALAEESLSELAYDNVDDDEKYSSNDNEQNIWETIAETIFKEITANTLEESAAFTPYGHRADELSKHLESILESYSYIPAAPKLLSAMEKIISTKHQLDPRPYTTFVVNVMNSDAAKFWNNEIRVFR
jgi:hypothetical protein